MGTLLIYFLVAALSWGRESLYKKPEAMIEQKKPVAPLKVTKPQSIRPLTGNLDAEIKSNIILEASGSRVILPSAKVKRTHPGLRPGEVLTAVIEESLMAFRESKTPVKARALEGVISGGVFLGEASIEANSKRIVVRFKQFIPRSNEEIYEVVGNALDTKGMIGLEGEYKTEEGKFFTAEFLSAATLGLADASIKRNQNIWGNYQEEPTSDTVSKKAAISALSRTTERIAERVRHAPSYSIISGPIVLRILLE